MNNKRLVRKNDDRILFGVASGLADYMGMDPVIVRLLFVLMTLLGAPGVIVYIIMLVIMPEETVIASKANPFDEEEIIIKGA